MNFEESKKNVNLSLAAMYISAAIFVTGMLLVVLNAGENTNHIGLGISFFGGVLLLGSYLIMKHSLRKVKDIQETDH